MAIGQTLKESQYEVLGGKDIPLKSKEAEDNKEGKAVIRSSGRSILTVY
jgi:hypothetical protein